MILGQIFGKILIVWILKNKVCRHPTIFGFVWTKIGPNTKEHLPSQFLNSRNLILRARVHTVILKD